MGWSHISSLGFHVATKTLVGLGPMPQCVETGERESVQLHGRSSGFQGLVNACDDWDEKEWRLGWLAVAKRRAGPVERMARWMERWKKREEAPVVVQAPREASSVQGVAEKIRWGWRLDLLASPSVGHSPVENHFLAPHCRELETFCWQAWHSFPSAFLFLCQALHSTILSNPPSSTAVHERSTKPSMGVKASIASRSRPPWDLTRKAR